jgi:hypothetical protein
VHLPLTVQGAEVLRRLYYRNIPDGTEVPTGEDEALLTVYSHALLPAAVRGTVRYFHRLQAGEEMQLEEVDQTTYEGLPADEQEPIRYFRKAVGLGNQTPFDEAGDTLSLDQYNQLSQTDRGWVIGRGRLVRVRFAATVFLHGTRLQVAVRHSGAEVPWQPADGEDATGLRPAQGLSIGALGADQVIDDVRLAPNPFTPNGDGINDVVRIAFSLFKVYQARPLSIQIFTLDGRPVRLIEGMVSGGSQVFEWDGRDDGGKGVVPGLYLCQIEVDTDAEEVDGQKRVRLVAVAY